MDVTHLDLELNDRPDVLARVVLLLRRRGCEIVSLQYSSAGPEAPARLVVGLRVPARRPVRAWLEALIDVRAVREI